ncbi:MAG: hypothetical protein JWN94_895, partial [Betaproteobacteria bacterium]|nr:hypothetical protein [Betaproteobacteria bacterium]
MSRRALIAALLLFASDFAHAQSTLMPPECAGKTSAQLDQCVRDLTRPTAIDQIEPVVQDSSQMLNCTMVNRADEGFCIARNEIVLECRKAGKYPDFNACANRLVERPQRPVTADCSRVVSAKRNECALRNKFFAECLRDPWRYFTCLGE